MVKLRLLFTKECNRNCKGCCNKDWNLDGLPTVTNFSKYDEILITGGEPLLFYKELIGFIKALRIVSNAKIYVYTAMTVNKYRTFKPIYEIIKYVDGVTLTLHNQSDSDNFNHVLYSQKYDEETFRAFCGKSLRLNIFKNIIYSKVAAEENGWIIKDNMVWIDNCPLPIDEEFMKL